LDCIACQRQIEQPQANRALDRISNRSARRTDRRFTDAKRRQFWPVN